MRAVSRRQCQAERNAQRRLSARPRCSRWRALRLGDEAVRRSAGKLSDPDAVLAAAAPGRSPAPTGTRGTRAGGAREERPLSATRRVLLVRAIATYRSLPARESDLRDVLIDVLRRDTAAEVRRAAADELTKFQRSRNRRRVYRRSQERSGSDRSRCRAGIPREVPKMMV